MSNVKQKVILKFKDDSFVSHLTSLLLKAGKVKIVGLGIFEIKRIPAREGYNVGTGERFIIPEHNKVSFRPNQKLKDLAQEYGDA